MINFNHKAITEQFKKILERAGATFTIHTAQTGTVYMTIAGADDDHQDLKIRIADHGECYCSEDFSIDPEGINLKQAVEFTGKYCGYNVTRSLAAFKAAQTRRAAKHAEAAAQFQPALKAAKAEWEAREAFQKAYITKNHPDYDQQPPKKRKRIRHRANKAYVGQGTSK
ncbi:MAG: hypothetical protein OIF56_14875 [Cohaesibacter sp.]|nr:hypothetical protein [Cohaesibacter sp.]